MSEDKPVELLAITDEDGTTVGTFVKPVGLNKKVAKDVIIKVMLEAKDNSKNFHWVTSQLSSLGFVRAVTWVVGVSWSSAR